MDDQPRVSKRGGFRPGSGRKPLVTDAMLAEKRALIEGEAADYKQVALSALVDVAEHGLSEAARVSAACAILDRAFGRPRQQQEHSGKVGIILVQHPGDENLL